MKAKNPNSSTSDARSSETAMDHGLGTSASGVTR